MYLDGGFFFLLHKSKLHTCTYFFIQNKFLWICKKGINFIDNLNCHFSGYYRIVYWYISRCNPIFKEKRQARYTIVPYFCEISFAIRVLRLCLPLKVSITLYCLYHFHKKLVSFFLSSRRGNQIEINPIQLW